MSQRVSLADLLASRVPIYPDQAAALVRELCRQQACGQVRGIPPLNVIKLTSRGEVVAAGPLSADRSAVQEAGSLLTTLLADAPRTDGHRMPGGLRLIAARACRTLDLPPFGSTAELAAALARFASPDVSEVARDLFRAWSVARRGDGQVVNGCALTISDVRRARRATGLSLGDVARTADVPAERLRELEWGYLRNWQADERGRAELRRYARATGLDEDLGTHGRMAAGGRRRALAIPDGSGAGRLGPRARRHAGARQRTDAAPSPMAAAGGGRGPGDCECHRVRPGFCHRIRR